MGTPQGPLSSRSSATQVNPPQGSPHPTSQPAHVESSAAAPAWMMGIHHPPSWGPPSCAYLSPGYNVVNLAKSRNVVVFWVGGRALSPPAVLASLLLQPQQCDQLLVLNCKYNCISDILTQLGRKKYQLLNMFCR